MDIKILWEEVKEEGRRAFFAGIKRQDNPYCQATSSLSPFVAWETGWLETSGSPLAAP